MILGMTTFTFIHVLLSLIGIAAGLIVALGLLTSARMSGMTALFLATTVLTSVTGFGFPFEGFKPSYVVGAISLVVLIVALYALYGRRLSGAWRAIYVVAAVIALYLNVFVLIVQAFMKIQPLKDLAPTQSEPPFTLTQGVVLVIFILVGIVGALRFHPERV
jgi:hypothetical protein